MSKQYSYAGEVLGATPSPKPVVNKNVVAEAKPSNLIAGEELNRLSEGDSTRTLRGAYETLRNPIIQEQLPSGATNIRLKDATPILAEVDGKPVTKHIPDRDLRAADMEQKGADASVLNAREWLNNRLQATSKKDKRDYKLQLDSEQMDRARLSYNGNLVRQALANKYGQQWANATSQLEAIKTRYAKLIEDADPMKREELRASRNDDLNAELARLTAAGNSNYYLTEDEQRDLFGDSAADDDYLRDTYLATDKVRGTNEANTATSAKTLWGIKNLYNIENNPVVQKYKLSNFDSGKEKVIDDYNGATENYVYFDGKDYAVRTVNYDKDDTDPRANGFGKPEIYYRKFSPAKK